MTATVVHLSDWQQAQQPSAPAPLGHLRPFPFADLEAVMGTGLPVQVVAGRLGLGRRQVYRYRQYGLTVAQADVLAVRLGLHPGQVWGSAWWVTA